MSEYGCHHRAWVDKDPDDIPAVCLANDDDAYYMQYFTDEEKLTALIESLITLRRIAFEYETNKETRAAL